MWPRWRRAGARVSFLLLLGMFPACSSKPQPMAGPASSAALPTAAPGGASTAAPGGASTAAPGGAPTAAPAGASTAAPAGASTAVPGGAPGASAPVPALAVDAPAPPRAGVRPAPFGVRWRAALPRISRGEDDNPTLIALRDRIIVSRGTTIAALDPATGKVLRSARVPHTRLVGDQAALTATTGNDQFGIDPVTLVPTWRARAPNALIAVGDWLVETPSAPSGPVLWLFRASDGQILRQLPEAPDSSVTAQRFLVGQTLYIQLPHRVAAIELPDGRIRWRLPGTLASASGDRIAVAVADGQFTIVDADGRAQWSAACSALVLHGDMGYATTSQGLAAIDLRTNTVAWRRPGVTAYASDDDWVFAWGPPGGATASKLVVLAADTGEIAAQLPVTRDDASTLAAGSTIAAVNGTWIVAFGKLARPEPLHAIDARVCLIVRGCQTNTAPLVGATVQLGGTSAVTDRRGCFRYRASVGLAPLDLTVSGGSMAGRPAAFDTPFPDRVVLDRSALTLEASYLGAGCHDSSPGTFP